MQISKVTLIASLAGALGLELHAQPATAEQQNKAIELLRQTIAQEQKQPSTSHPAISHPLPVGTVPAAETMITQPTTAVTSQPAPMVAANPATTDQQQRALALLRQTIAQERANMSQPVATSSTQTSGSSVRPTTKSAKPAPAVQGGVAANAGQTGAVSAQPAAPEQPAGPKTKQQRLMELLDQYKADKLTPAEYHAQRAKILSEP
jgi:hypothetical protein